MGNFTRWLSDLKFITVHPGRLDELIENEQRDAENASQILEKLIKAQRNLEKKYSPSPECEGCEHLVVIQDACGYEQHYCRLNNECGDRYPRYQSVDIDEVKKQKVRKRNEIT